MQLLTPDLGLLIWTLLAFLIVFFLLKKFAWPAIIKGLSDREANIASSIATAEKIKLEMAQLKNDNEALLIKAREENPGKMFYVVKIGFNAIETLTNSILHRA